jgi:hypothetical protein
VTGSSNKRVKVPGWVETQSASHPLSTQTHNTNIGCGASDKGVVEGETLRRGGSDAYNEVGEGVRQGCAAGGVAQAMGSETF